jgi:hypothetical protein
MTRYLNVVFIMFAFAIGSWAQGPPHHHQKSATVIDGATNPEMIPDDTAFRLWLVTVSTLPNSTEQERERQAAHLSRLNLVSPLDRPVLQSILTDFKTQYTSLISRYNEAQEAAWARGVVSPEQQQSDLKLFLQQRDDLVATTRAAISKQLSADGANHVTAHVQSEKQHMKLHVSKEGQ